MRNILIIHNIKSRNIYSFFVFIVAP